MATKQANIQVGLKAGDFVSGMKSLEKETTASGKKMTSAFARNVKKDATGAFAVVESRWANTVKGMAAGGKAQLKSMWSGLSDKVKMAGEIGGLFAFGSLAKDAVTLRSEYSRIGLQIRAMGGDMMSVEQIQSRIEGAVQKTGRSQGELTDAVKIMLDRGAKSDFAFGSLEAVGALMNTTGMDAERVGRAVAALSVKYGLTGEQAGKAASKMVEAAARGGVTIEEFMEDFNELGSHAGAAGLKGERGMNMMLRVIELMGPKVNGTMSEVSSGADIVMERLRDAAIVERLFKDAGKGSSFKATEFAKMGDFTEQALYTMETGGLDVMKKLREEFPGREEMAAFEAFFGPYFEEFKKAKDAGKSETDASSDAKAAQAKWLEAMQQGTDSTIDVIKESEKIAAESPVAAFNRAQSIMLKAFSDPKMMSAIRQLAQQLPRLAEAISQVIGFILDNPMLAGGMYVGGRMALGAAQGGIEAYLKGGAQAGAEAAGSFGKGAKGADWGGMGALFAGAAVVAISAAIDQWNSLMKESQGAFTSADFWKDVMETGDVATAVERHQDRLAQATPQGKAAADAWAKQKQVKDAGMEALMNAMTEEQMQRVFELQRGGMGLGEALGKTTGEQKGYEAERLRDAYSTGLVEQAEKLGLLGDASSTLARELEVAAARIGKAIPAAPGAASGPPNAAPPAPGHGKE